MNLVNQLTPKPKPSVTPKFTTSITNSTNYVGELENDYKHGFGIQKVPTYNYTYIGEYYNNKRAGFGFYIYWSVKIQNHKRLNLKYGGNNL